VAAGFGYSFRLTTGWIDVPSATVHYGDLGHDFRS
jgi:hypothetical protein